MIHLEARKRLLFPRRRALEIPKINLVQSRKQGLVSQNLKVIVVLK
jgi:hypothetical protein